MTTIIYIVYLPIPRRNGMARVTHFEISAKDPEKLKKFYETVFEWKFDKWEGPMDYWMIMTGEGPGINGGLSRKSEQTMDINSIDVSNLDEYMKKVESNGGTIIAPKSAIPGVGWFAVFEDSEGNAFGMMQEDENAK
jgi:predicted enzyme related to lactoylglutathione lyase